MALSRLNPTLWAAVVTALAAAACDGPRTTPTTRPQPATPKAAVIPTQQPTVPRGEPDKKAEPERKKEPEKGKKNDEFKTGEREIG